MGFQAGIKIFCKTSIESFLVDLGLQDVNIIEHGSVRLRQNGFGATDFASLKPRSEILWPAET